MRRLCKTVCRAYVPITGIFLVYYFEIVHHASNEHCLDIFCMVHLPAIDYFVTDRRLGRFPATTADQLAPSLER